MLTLGWAELGKQILYRIKVVYHWMLKEILTAKKPVRTLKQAQESLAAAMSLYSVCHSNYCLRDFKFQLAACNL